jgi:2-isopropylmalate synthase
MAKIFIYDTTLRDGAQREEISFSLNDKLTIAKRLDEFGVDYIEGGWPGSNPKDAEFFQQVRGLGLKHAKISAFGSTRRKNGSCEDDHNLRMLLDAHTPVVTLVGKTWDFHVDVILETSQAENLAMIQESVAYMKAHGKEVVFDAEHFFDGYKANPAYALAALQAAAAGGADFLVLCETNGGCLPWEITEITGMIQSRLPAAALGVHCHDDGGCAVANSLAAVQAGCIQVQGTINGYGERVGNANLVSIIPNLQLKMGCEVVSDEQLRGLTGLARFVAEIANLPPDPHQPFVGHSAFAHKGGIHVAAVLKAEHSYQHIKPTLVGNQKRAVVSELSGRGNLQFQAETYGLDVDDDASRQVLTQIKKLEYQGFTFEAAEASVNLLLYRAVKNYCPPFVLVDFMVVTEQRQGRGLFAEAMVKVRIGEDLLHTAAEGNGPVNALNKALRKALSTAYPQVESIRLTDYKVRILDGKQGTAAITRVLIDFDDGVRTWTTVGASTNIIEASWQALSDSMEYALVSSPVF